MQQRLEEKVAESAKYYGINFNSNNSAEDIETEDSNEPELDGEGLDADLATGNKDTCVLEVIIHHLFPHPSIFIVLILVIILPSIQFTKAYDFF